MQITIIGLGQIGCSVGLALADHKNLLRRVGHDLDYSAARQAMKMGALDKVTPNIFTAVRNADLILLALPMDEIRKTMEAIASELKTGAVLMDTAPVKEVVAAWAEELFPDGVCSYVGLTPVVNPKYLSGETFGIDAANADLFRGGLMAIVSSANTDSGAIKKAADLVRLLGAESFLADIIEVDGLMTTAHIVPQFMAAALLNATVDQPGWRDTRKLAGRAYAEVSGPIIHLGKPGALANTALLNRENVLRVMDSVIAALKTLRKDIEKQDEETLTSRLERAQEGRQRWWQERLTSDWAAVESPKVQSDARSDVFGNLFRFGRRPKIDRD